MDIRVRVNTIGYNTWLPMSPERVEYLVLIMPSTCITSAICLWTREKERATERMESLAHFFIVQIWFAVITLAYGVGEFQLVK